MNQNEWMALIRTKVIMAVGKSLGKRFIPAAVSNRHVHLCRRDIDRLFGPGYSLTPLRNLSQPGQFAAKETVTLRGPKGAIKHIRVLGPERADTQLEISTTDSYTLGIQPVVRMSGHIESTPGGVLETATGEVELTRGVIVSARHIHLSDEQAAALQLKNGQVVSLRSTGERAIILDNVVVRSGEGHHFEVHLDTDEANAGQIRNGDLLEIVPCESRADADNSCNEQPSNQEPSTLVASSVIPAPSSTPSNCTSAPLTLVVEDDIIDAMQAGQKTVACTSTAIVTPLAYDTARERGVEIKRV